MHIYIFGNLNSGKTTLSQQIQRRLPEFPYLSLDEYRIRFGDGTEQGEQLACEYFLAAVKQQENAIVEFTGYGQTASLLTNQLDRKTGISICCTRDIEQSINSINDEKYSETPYPSSYKRLQAVDEAIIFLKDKVMPTALETHWQRQIWQSYCFDFSDNFDAFWAAFPLSQHTWVSKLNKVLSTDTSVSTALLYGSLGANQLTKRSDIDLFIQSSISVQEWHERLLRLFGEQLTHTDILGSKITLRTQDRLLIEIVVGQSLSDIFLYYRESQIYNVHFTILKGEFGLAEQLDAVTKAHTSEQKQATELAAQVYFLFCSLPNLIANNDSYKYHFHCAIIQHYCVQLEHLLLSEFKHNYLPKHAATTLIDFPWQAFECSATRIITEQYVELYQYLITLFEKLRTKQLIESNDYFSVESRFLHEIPSEDYKA
ncbi:nucleotidyltransferase domain-containing protein [Vibrio furnissii]